MSDEIMNQLNSSSDPHSPVDQVKCLLCQAVPDQYISLDCKDDFCLACLAQKYDEMKQSNEVLINDYNNYEVYCPACKVPTLLDEVSINALQDTLLLMKTGKKKSELFNEIIMEDSAENYNNDDALKIEEKKSFEANNWNNKNFFGGKNNLEEERKENDLNLNIVFEKPDFLKDKYPSKPKNNSNDNDKFQKFDSKPVKKISNEPINNIFASVQEKKDKPKPVFDSNMSQKTEFLDKTRVSEPKCNKHKNETTNLFCFTCETSCLCVECLVEGVHRNHNVKNIQKGMDVLTERLINMNERISQKSSENKEILNKLENEKNNSVSLVKENIETIQNNFNEIKHKLQQKEQEILKEYDKISQEKIKQIERIIQDLQRNKETLIDMQPPQSTFEKLSVSAQIGYYNAYSEKVQKLSKMTSIDQNALSLVLNSKTQEIKNPINLNALNNLYKTIDVLPNEWSAIKQKPLKKEPSDEMYDNNFNRKLRMESEYLQEMPNSLESNTNQQAATQSSSFVGVINDFKLPQRRGLPMSLRNPFKNLMLSSDKSSSIIKTKDFKGSGDGFRLSSKGWSKTPTHSNEYLERQQRKFEKQKEFFFQNLK